MERIDRSHWPEWARLAHKSGGRRRRAAIDAGLFQRALARGDMASADRYTSLSVRGFEYADWLRSQARQEYRQRPFLLLARGGE